MPRSALPKLNDGQSESYRVRPATPDDLPFVVETDLHSHQRYLIAALRNEHLWRLWLDGSSETVGQVIAIEDSLGAWRQAPGATAQARMIRGHLSLSDSPNSG